MGHRAMQNTPDSGMRISLERVSGVSAGERDVLCGLVGLDGNDDLVSLRELSRLLQPLTQLAIADGVAHGGHLDAIQSPGTCADQVNHRTFTVVTPPAAVA